MYKIKKFANLVGVSVRMLHHYDKIGLLIPESTSRENNYRYYGQKNLIQMQQVLFFKELDFSLKEIKKIIHSDTFNKTDALIMQKNLLSLQKQRLEKMINFIDTQLDGNQPILENQMSKEMKKAMDETAIENKKIEYAKEAKNKWGDTDNYKQSQKRLAKYSQKDIKQLNKQQQEIYKQLAGLMSKGINAPTVQEKVHEARMFISDNWYECSMQQFAALGEMYVEDQRFIDNIDKSAKGLAEFLSEAIKVYVSNHKTVPS